MNILIGGAWPYANGSMHIGHIAALLPGDVLARYFRLKGDSVIYVSGSDCHGTPISIRAKEEGISPQEIADKYHNEFCMCFDSLGFSYDYYTKTTTEYHKNFVEDFIKKLFDNGSLYEKETLQVYCEKCDKFLPDRYVDGICPICGSDARGDQCDNCGSLLEPEMLKEMRCSLCNSQPILKPSTQLYINIIRLQKELTEYVYCHKDWRTNAQNLSRRYIEEGLQDRAITRDLDWGTDVPVAGYKNKKIYVWIDAVLGYLSACKKFCENKQIDFYEFWNSSQHYYVHGKDNIPFHTIILPSLLLSYGNLHLPDEIISSEYVTLEGKKISTSKNWAVWIDYLIEKYDPDLIRYFFITNGPEKRDTNFSWLEFINSNNGELLGAYGNFVNRTLVFINKYFDNKIPKGTINGELKEKTNQLFVSAGDKIEKGNFKDSLDEIFEFVRSSNKYYDAEKPWVTRVTDPEKCNSTIFNCVQIIANLSVLLNPFLPFSSSKIQNWLSISSISANWCIKFVESGLVIPTVDILFKRIDKKVIDEEIKNLSNFV
ncbi:methionine--tRNA ligase [Clostridium estertheticum]|uniref:methionine--tRNA ligase n=1 Tax=Clostridium estertheticum TaxID=238834 RepID=UPI001C0AD263|nr:methionine--tRNA ligase [Clostridium estertheticum]MBU3201951.1 methionine--tRNA ligase [Clostridium estertheticum]WAG67807.1 methionine--tRNA ligase [Clostridium estertheticum]